MNSCISSRIPDVLVLMMLFICLPAFYSCQSNEEVTPAPKPQTQIRTEPSKKDTLIRELTSDPQYLNPVLSNDYNSSSVENLIFDSLLDVDGSADYNLVPRLAEKWEISADKLTYTFFLRRDVRWHDGKPFTAADVKFTFDMAMDDAIPAVGWKSIVEPIERVKIKDLYTIQFVMKYPFSPGLIKIGAKLIVPRHCLDEAAMAEETHTHKLKKSVTLLTTKFNRHPVGTGPYVFREWKTTQDITLVRNEHYWDNQHFPKIKQVAFKIFHSRTVAFNVLKIGDLDVLRSTTDHYRKFMKMTMLNQTYTALKFYWPAYYYVGWNCRADHRIFSDRRVRRAMTYALNRKGFNEKIRHGLGKLISGPFYFQSWANNPAIKPLPYDITKAAELLKEAGWEDHDDDGLLDKNGVPFRFNLIISSGSPTYAQLAPIIQANMKKLSIQVLIHQYEWSVYLKKYRRGEFDAVIGGWALEVDPDPYSAWHSSQIEIGSNHIGYQNSDVDRLLEEGRRTFDREQRKKIYHKIHEILHEDQPCTFFFTSMETYILSKRIYNVFVSPWGLFDFYPGQLSWTLEDE